MFEIEINNISGDAKAALDEAVFSLGLHIVLESTLAKFPGSRHWHLRRENRAGTLEVTYWPPQNRLWVSYHANRIGDGWVVEAAKQLAAALSGGSDGVLE